MAKNQYSLSDDPKKLGRPEGFDITIREIYVNAGAGFLVALTGDVMTMPGLPKKPAAVQNFQEITVVVVDTQVVMDLQKQSQMEKHQ